MTIQDILDRWRDGDEYRNHVRDLCNVTALSRYKIIGEPISGLYGPLKDEAFVLRLALKANKDDYQDVFVGSYAGPRLLGTEDIPPCFNPLQTVQGDGGEDASSGTSRKGHRFTPYNKELYTVINLLFIVLRMNRTRQDGPVSTCLGKLSRYGDLDLTPYWAWKMNDLMGKYKSNVADINSRLQDTHGNARVFDFPLIRQRLEQDDRLSSHDILF